MTCLLVVACELFVTDLSTRAWACAEEARRKGIQVGTAEDYYLLMGLLQ